MLQALLLEELASVRSAFRDSVGAYLLRVDSNLVHVVDLLTDAAATGDRTASMAALRQACDLIERLRLKPEKGRRKDLHAVEELAGLLDALTASW